MYSEDEFLMLSGVQHFAFCRRQWALIHVEQQWLENSRTADGIIFHEKAHDEESIEKRGNILITRGLRVHSFELGLSGQCDVVEFHAAKNGILIRTHEGRWLPYPIEYKIGEPKSDSCDEIGLDSYAGFLHRDRPGRVSLALDLMEEMRPVLVDRFVLTLINLKQIQERDFVETDSGAVLLTEEGRKKFITAWQVRKKEEIKHPFLQEKISWGLVPNIQAQLLARYLRGDMDDYPPFFWK